jgi:hypothetical protein
MDWGKGRKLWYPRDSQLFSFGCKMNKYLKFGVPILLIVSGLAYLAVAGVQESKSYYVTI